MTLKNMGRVFSRFHVQEKTPAFLRATHRFGVYSILQGFLGLMFLVLESKFTWRTCTQALIEKIIICSVA